MADETGNLKERKLEVGKGETTEEQGREEAVWGRKRRREGEERIRGK